VNLLLDPQRFVYQSRLKMFSTEGRSFSFDERANGYGRGEGFTGVMLKPLSAALRDGNHVRAVIRNSVINQDGRTPGISVPSAVAQKEAILKAYRQAKLDLYADYFEAHGTGTRVGDPVSLTPIPKPNANPQRHKLTGPNQIEVSAIAAAFTMNKFSGSSRRLPIGSIKGNIGHTEGAAGLAGLIKAVLMLENGMIPPQVNYEKCNPDLLLDQWKLRVGCCIADFSLLEMDACSPFKSDPDPVGKTKSP
jgi:emericellamide synthase (highly reducing iterative type I polyketide synthase)